MTAVKDIEVTASDDEVIDDVAAPEDSGADVEEEPASRRRIGWSRLFAYRVLPVLAALFAVGAGYLNWSGAAAPDSAALRDETIRIGSEDAVALLSYHAASVDKDLSGAQDRLTGDFKDAYSALIRQVVIPGAKEKHISVVAKASAAASVSVNESHAVVLVFVNQTVTIGDGRPTDTAPVVKVVLEKVKDRWLVSHFDPV
jgi:Mce-associated membrane protein